MSTHNYLDDLDNLLDDPKPSSAAPATSPTLSPVAVASPTAEQPAIAASLEDDAHQASRTWAQVIESATQALQESTRLSQEATHKTMALAKEQQENIKELSDASSGWRHSTRQAVQEVNATKKNIIILTVISGLIAIAGFGTTIGVMLQSRASFVSMSNAILENVDEHQAIVSKTLTLKMDELASTVEQMQASIDQLNASRLASNTAPNPIITAELAETNPNETITTPASAAADNPSIPDNTVVSEPVKLLTPTPAPAPSPIIEPKPQAVQPAAAFAQTVPQTHSSVSAEAWQQLLTQVDQLQQQLQHIEQNSLKQTQEQNKQWQQLATQVDEKLAARLAKLPTATADAPKANSSSTMASADTKPIMDQLTRLRQEMAELRLLQQSLKEQMGQVKQTVTESASKPYQYRLPQEGERYPR